MDASIVLWEQWQGQVKQLWPGMHGHQKKTLALGVLGVIFSGSAVLQRMAESIQERGQTFAKMPSIERRLARFVANERIQVSTIWQTFLSHVLVYWQGQPVRMVLDCTPCGDKATIVYLGLTSSKRLPAGASPSASKKCQGERGPPQSKPSPGQK